MQISANYCVVVIVIVIIVMLKLKIMISRQPSSHSLIECRLAPAFHALGLLLRFLSYVFFAVCDVGVFNGVICVVVLLV